MHAWGHPRSGGDPAAGVAEELSRGVQSVTGNAHAFAAVKSDGSVVPSPATHAIWAGLKAGECIRHFV